MPPIPDHLTDEDMLLALQQIPPHHQEVILLCDVEEMTYKEIAAALEVPIGTVMSRLHRGRELLRTALARRGAGPAAMRPGKRGTLIMQCRDVRELADSFLSEQLLVETNHELLRHLETCPDCRADIAGRRALRDGLRAAFARAEDLRPRPEFAAELLATLRPARGDCLSRERSRDARCCNRGGRSPRAWSWPPAAGCSCATRTRDRAWRRWRVRRPAITRTAPSSSISPSGRFRSKRPGGATARRTPRWRRSSRRRSTDPLEMLERHACVYQGRRFGHVVFRYRGALTSLLVTDGTPPATPELEPNDSGPAVASLPAGRSSASSSPISIVRHVLRLAQTLADPLSQHLA